MPDNSRFSAMYNNPNFDYMADMLPKNIKELFKWVELVVNNAPVVINGIRKLVNYPLTNFTYNTTSDKVREDTEDLLENKLDMRAHLINLGVDYYTYGNAFRTVYFPFDRFLQCKVCGRKTNITKVEYKLVRGKIVKQCECGARRPAEIFDEDSNDISRISLVSWDPNQMELAYNPVTSISTYYYSLPQVIQQGLAVSDPTIVNTLPRVFIDSFYQRKAIKFGANLFHFKAPGLSGYATGWGISPLMPALKPYLYMSILRKASEAIGLEHITPRNILFPQAATNDPSVYSSMSRWREEVTKAYKMWRRDPNHVMMAPYPTGVVNVGSQGRALTPTEELRDARQEMALALDIWPEFIYGTGTLEKSTVALRILENQLTPYTEQLVKYVNWVIRLINAKYKKNYCEVGLTPFTLADDMMKKQMLMQTAGSLTSARTLMEALDIDPDDENERLTEEQVDAHRRGKEVERRITEEEQNIANQTQEEATANAMGTIPEYDQQKLMAHAQNIAQQLIMIPYEERRSHLSQLQNEDYVMWAMVSKLLESMHDQEDSAGAGMAGTGQGGTY